MTLSAEQHRSSRPGTVGDPRRAGSARPTSFRPDITGDDAGIGAEEGCDAAWDGQSALRVETPRQPFPFLTVPEESPQRGDLPCFRGSFQWLAEAVVEPGSALDVVADLHPVQRGDPGCAGLASPGSGIDGVGVFGLQPSADSQQRGTSAATNARSQCRGVVPAFDPAGRTTPCSSPRDAGCG